MTIEEKILSVEGFKTAEQLRKFVLDTLKEKRPELTEPQRCKIVDIVLSVANTPETVKSFLSGLVGE